MRTSLLAFGFLAFGLVHCASDRGLFVGADRDAGDGGGGEPGETGGASTGGSGGTGGGSTGGSENGGTENTGGSNRGGSGAEAGEPSETGGTGAGGTDAGGTDSGGTNPGGSGGSGGSAPAGSGGTNEGGRAGSANAGAGAGGMNDGGRAGSAGAGGTSNDDCEALASEYLERLAAVQECSLQLPFEQCTLHMPDDFFCPCTTYVNPMRESDIRRMNEILEKRTSCVRVCPAIACPDVKRGVCTVNGSLDLGRCTAAP